VNSPERASRHTQLLAGCSKAFLSIKPMVAPAIPSFSDDVKQIQQDSAHMAYLTFFARFLTSNAICQMNCPQVGFAPVTPLLSDLRAAQDLHHPWDQLSG